MKKKVYSFIVGSLIASSTLVAQEQKLDVTNMREGESVEYCISHKLMDYYKKDPAYAPLIENARAEFYGKQKAKGENVTTKATVFKIPVVFHILHNGGEENISKEQILDAVAILNRDFRRLNADANSVQTPFQGMPTDVEIEFELATKAPNGSCFSGITRTQSSATNVTDATNGGIQQINAIIAGNDVYQNAWPHTKYLNIVVAAGIGGAAGYTMQPWTGTATNSQNMRYNSIFILHNYLGSIGTSNVTNSRALTHEVGHWLGLDHVWGPSNNPGDPTSCSIDDGIQDTPMCIGVTSCNLSSNTCNDMNDPNNFSSWGFDVVDNVENYMDYSYCSKMFTPNQVTAMRSVIQNSTAGRNQLITVANHTATGINTTPTLCKAAFSTSRRVICAGETITFTDESYNAATGWTWTFTGGTPSSSNVQNPSVTYNTPGTFAVKLVATDGSNSNTAEINAYITVLPSSFTIPFFEGFETGTLTSPRWEVYNPAGNGWEISTASAATGGKSVRLMNFNQTSGQVDELLSGVYDLSNVTSATGLTLSFKYAYRKRANTNTDVLSVHTSSDCGENWMMRRTLNTATLGGSAPLVNTSWTPTSSDYVTYHVTNIPSSAWTSNFKFKFRFVAGGGNNIYLDDINLYAGSQGDYPVLGLNEYSELDGLSLFPNPADQEIQVNFNSKVGDNKLELQIVDITGKVLQTYPLIANEGANTVFVATDELAAGTYMVRMIGSAGNQLLKFVKK